MSRIIGDLVDQLGEYQPTIFVLKESEHDGRTPGLSFPTEVVAEDLTRFLSRLFEERRQPTPDTHFRSVDERWLSSAFFATLQKAVSLPSETQVIDAFLEHLLEEISARRDVSGVLDDAEAAVSDALEVRPNYEAVRKTWDEVTEMLRPLSATADAEIALESFRNARADRIRHFRELGAALIGRNERILIYSQSQRAIQALLGVPVSVQKTIHLFVAECRPKSPRPYQDASAICQQLADTHYAITVCPDVVAGHLIQDHQIDRMILGTHAVFSDPMDGHMHSFVNTCGSGTLAIVAASCGVRVDVIAEEIKIENVTALDARDNLHTNEENDLLESAVGLKEVTTRRAAVEHLNIGYDLVPITSGINVFVPDQSPPAVEIATVQ